VRVTAAEANKLMKTKQNKYGAKKVTVGDETWDSQLEYSRWCDLVLMEKAGEITELQRQVEFPYEENDKVVFVYVADVVYSRSGTRVVEDAKGMRTPVFNLKKKLIESRYGITIELYPSVAKKRRTRGVKRTRVQKQHPPIPEGLKKGRR
jgi:hypothetical protein